MKKIDLIKKIIFIVIILLLIFIGIYSFVYVIPKKETKKEEEITNGYILYDRDSDVYKEIFNELKTLFNTEMDYNSYATHLSKLFLIDLYTLEGKTGETDITSSQYVFNEVKDMFVSKVSNTLYRNIGLNKELPKVNNVEVLEITDDKYIYNEIEYDAFKVKCTITYENDYGYDKNVLLTLIKNEDKLWVVSLETIND